MSTIAQPSAGVDPGRAAAGSGLAVPLHVRPLTLATNLLLAPIAGWCDLAWRLTVREIGRGIAPGVSEVGLPLAVAGLGLACTDLLSPQGLMRGSEATLEIARSTPEDRPLCMQLYGCDPQVLAEGARWCADHGAAVVDINMGCPVDKVTKRDGGSKLMCSIGSTVALAERIRRALPDGVPLTAKMRLGWSEADAERNTAGMLACRLADAGIAAVTVHGRTTEQLFKGFARLEGIRRVVEAVGEHTGAYRGDGSGGIPVIGNGDICSPEDAVRMLEATGCAGVMIGRGAFAMPWIFRDCWDLQRRLATGIAAQVSPISEADKLEIIRRYTRRLVEFRSERAALHTIRQKISWLGRHIAGSHCGPLKRAVREAPSTAAVLAAIDGWERFGDLAFSLRSERAGAFSDRSPEAEAGNGPT